MRNRRGKHLTRATGPHSGNAVGIGDVSQGIRNRAQGIRSGNKSRKPGGRPAGIKRMLSIGARGLSISLLLY